MHATHAGDLSDADVVRIHSAGLEPSDLTSLCSAGLTVAQALEVTLCRLQTGYDLRALRHDASLAEAGLPAEQVVAWAVAGVHAEAVRALVTPVPGRLEPVRLQELTQLHPTQLVDGRVLAALGDGVPVATVVEVLELNNGVLPLPVARMLARGLTVDDVRWMLARGVRLDTLRMPSPLPDFGSSTRERLCTLIVCLLGCPPQVADALAASWVDQPWMDTVLRLLADDMPAGDAVRIARALEQP